MGSQLDPRKIFGDLLSLVGVDMGDYQLVSARNQANGYLGLDVTGKAEAAQLPSMTPADGSITTAMLAPAALAAVSTSKGPFIADPGSMPVTLRLLVGGGTPYAGVASAGRFVYAFRPEDTTYLHQQHSETLTYAAVNNGNDTYWLNQLFLLPDHGACTIKGYSGTLQVGVAGGSIVYCKKVEFSLVKISSGGVETVLDLFLTPSNNNEPVDANYRIQNPYTVERLFAGFAIAAGERLGLRIRTLGASTVVGYHSINADAGATTGPAATGYKKSFFRFSFE